MSEQFCIYSTDITATLDPQNADPAPATLVVFEQDPLFGEYDQAAGTLGRGSKFETLGDVVFQDFGVVEKDGQIRIAEDNVPMSAGSTFIADVKTLHAAVNTEYFFTDGVNCWRVRFARPGGFVYRRNLLFKIKESLDVFSYEILFDVVSKEI
ncbi:MAG: hypothetical protein JRJ54_14385 [Deltaproteobacteria bacterium]|nr:hypothetical protein [Deltaproteobacteria bacterium]